MFYKELQGFELSDINYLIAKFNQLDCTIEEFEGNLLDNYIISNIKSEFGISGLVSKEIKDLYTTNTIHIIMKVAYVNRYQSEYIVIITTDNKLVCDYQAFFEMEGSGC